MLRLKVSDRPLSGGPDIFRKKFIKEINSRNNILISRDRNFDCELCFISFERTHRKPALLRLDGCYVDKKRFGMNKSIVSSIRNSNYQIYQSEFSKKLFKKMLNIDVSNSSVIYNGVDTSRFEYIAWEDKDPMSFVSCATWRENKRPNSIISGFLEADIKDSQLYFIGSGKFNKIKDPRIKYLGDIKNSEVIEYLKRSRYYVNLSYMESCPNSVIEAISCGCRVLCGNLGGTSEIVNSSDVVCDIDPVFNFKLQRNILDNISPSIVAGGMKKLASSEYKSYAMCKNSILPIEKCIDKYIEVIERIV